MNKAKLVYVMGASGSGKDSVMDRARRDCPPQRAAFAHRYITRPADAGGENHVCLSPGEFQARLDKGLFVLNWDSHGLRYGIGREIDLWLDSGLSVAVNGSRVYLPEAARRYPDLVPVLIDVDEEVLRRRLIQRGREDEAEIEKRLVRAREHAGIDHPRAVRIDNSGRLSESGAALLRVLLGE